MFIWTVSLEMTDTITSQNIDLFSWITLYLYIHFLMVLFFCEIFRLAVIALHETSVLVVTWLTITMIFLYVDSRLKSQRSLFTSRIPVWNVCICVDSVCCVHNNDRLFSSHWSFVGFLGMGLSSPCKVTCHSKTVSCSDTVLSVDTICACNDLITRYHCP